MDWWWGQRQARQWFKMKEELYRCIRPICRLFRSQNCLKIKEIFSMGLYFISQGCTELHFHPSGPLVWMATVF